jgi:hypothetical protein
VLASSDEPAARRRADQALEFVQAVIGRLANDSFLMKGWAVTVAGLIFGFAADQKSWQIAAAALIPVAAFWGLDAYFLRQERLFRCLYDAVRRSEPSVEPFLMDTSGHSATVVSWWTTVRSRTLLRSTASLYSLGSS